MRWNPALAKWGEATLQSLDQIIEVAERTPDEDPRREKQRPPGGEWVIWLLRPGRGFGKTFAGAFWVLDRVATGAKQIALVSATSSDVRDTMILNRRSGIVALAEKYMPHLVPEYFRSEAKLKFPNGAEAKIFSAEKPERARGPEHDSIWIDELDALGDTSSPKKANAMLDNLLFGLRIGDDPRMMCTSTPKPGRLVARLSRRAKEVGDVVLTGGSTYENEDNLHPTFLNEILGRYEGTRLGRQEIGGELLEDIEGAIFTRETLDRWRMPANGGGAIHLPDMVRIATAIDPSGSETGDECGIVAGGLGEDGVAYILHDASLQASPKKWAEVAVETSRFVGADSMIAEKNYGGEMVSAALQTEAPEIPVRLVLAKRAKHVRAEPVSILAEQGRVRMAGSFPELEDQICQFTSEGYMGEGSPDRADAFVYLVSDLLGTSWHFDRRTLDAAKVGAEEAW